MSDSDWWDRRHETGVYASGGGGQDFRKRHLFPCRRCGVKVIQICPHKSPVQGCGYIIGVAFDHEAEVQQSWLPEGELPYDISEQNAGDDGGAAGAKTAAEGDGVVDVDGGVAGEAALRVAAEDVEGGPREEVV